MESTGRRNKIQVSEEVAKLLIEADKRHWIEPRRDRVVVKGKGEMQTYWLKAREDMNHRISAGSAATKRASITDFSIDFTSASEGSMVESSTDEMASVTSSSQGTTSRQNRDKQLTPKVRRLVDWNTDMLSGIFQEIIARREATQAVADSETALDILEQATIDNTDNKNSLSEVREIINMPEFTASKRQQKDGKLIKLSAQVTSQLKDYVESIAKLYRSNEFHNFEHASHVTMSVGKLFSRIIAPDRDNIGGDNSDAKGLHDHTYGITSDPLTQVAVLLSALVHDVDHQGVPNSQLVQEKCRLADMYKNKSVAEQNSVDLAWELLMQPEYKEMRRTIYNNRTDFFRFRQLMVNTVLATDIMDKDLKQLRNNRWDKAFNNMTLNESSRDKVDRKATIVIEHLIQASDVAHTMQHWHIYRVSDQFVVNGLPTVREFTYSNATSPVETFVS